MLRYVAGVKDAQAISRMLEQMPTIFNSGLIAGFYEKMGMKLNVELQRKAETYKDVPIDALKFSFASTDANSPQGQMLSAMYGHGMNIRVAMVNNLLLYTAAAGPLACHTRVDRPGEEFHLDRRDSQRDPGGHATDPRLREGRLPRDATTSCGCSRWSRR